MCFLVRPLPQEYPRAHDSFVYVRMAPAMMRARLWLRCSVRVWRACQGSDAVSDSCHMDEGQAAVDAVLTLLDREFALHQGQISIRTTCCAQHVRDMCVSCPRQKCSGATSPDALRSTLVEADRIFFGTAQPTSFHVWGLQWLESLPPTR